MALSGVSIYIIRKLYGWNKIGEKYTNIHNVLRALPPKHRSKTILKGCIKELRNEGLVIIHKKGECISLNKHELGRIEDLILK